MKLITCATCRHFQPDPINPETGMGRCLHPARHGYFHAQAEHRCGDHEAKPESEHVATRNDRT